MPKDVKTRIRAARTTTAKARSEFAAAHRRGMASLKRRDYKALGEAIADESTAIDKLEGAVESAKGAVKRKR